MIYELPDDVMHAVPDPLAVLDEIERLNELPTVTLRIEGTYDDGSAPARPAES